MTPGDFNRKRAAIERRSRGRGSFQKRALARLVLEAKATAVVEGSRLIGWRMPDGRVACLKIRYRDQAGADVELVRVGHFAWQQKVPVRSYGCGHCGGWHLTSR